MALRVAGSALILALLFHFVPFAQAWQAMRRLPPLVWLAVLIGYFCAHLAGVNKYKLMLNGAGAGLTPSGDDLAGAALFGRCLVGQRGRAWSALAARLARALDRWRKFDGERQAHARAALERVRATPNLSRDTLEVVSRALA